MRVLIVAADIYGKVGGGETVYRKLIAANPGIEFVYFRRREPAATPRAPNARSVALKPQKNLRVAQPDFPQAKLDALRVANACAASVAGMDFDIVDLPDYFAYGALLRDCLAFHRVRFGALVLALHGTRTISLRTGWDSAGIDAIDELELEQYQGADARYAISKRYASQWRARAGLDVQLLDPLAIVGLPAGAAAAPAGGNPDLYCIGRMERRKGNDLFVEIVRWLDRSAYGRAFHVGEADYTRTGISSQEILTDMARARELQIGFLPGQDSAGLAGIFRGRSVTMLPVRDDPFNLLVLESLVNGCPTVVSNGAGVRDYLDENLPDLPYVKVDLDNLYAAVPQIESLLAGYDDHRRRLAEALGRLRVPPDGLEMLPIYEQALNRGTQAGSGRQAPAVAYAERLTSVAEISLELARSVIPVDARQAAKKVLRDPKSVLREGALRLGLFNDAKLVRQGVLGFRLRQRLQAVYLMPENGAADLERKVRAIHELASGPVFRCNVWRELARLERLRGNDLVAAAYEIRLMRLLGGDRFGQLAAVSAALRKTGFERVALACEAMYQSPEKADARVREFLQEASAHCRKSEPGAWELLDDRRSGEARVSVIVSLYNAAPKLRLFLTALAQQTLVRDRQVEVILVDSGSKTDEYAVAKEFLSANALSAVYARSAQRETIQAAWNRGIHLARAPYLAFLGTDETLYPEALKLLADELDGHPETDWVMANSLVTEVDERGVFRKDVFSYDRTGGTKDHAYLETCYLSWVGGMYRKAIHERFGYYDESFRAAGDTEFKNRVLPHIGVRFVPRMLGLFLNYPDARTTASPTAEIEDARAWYIHRSPGGVRFAFERRDPEDALRLLYASLGYRKCYARHFSSDIEYGRNLLGHALAAGAAPALAPLEGSLGGLLESYRRLEWADGNAPLPSPLRLLAQAWRAAGAREKAHAGMLRGKASPAYRVLNDNRYEQHFWHWDTF